MSDVDILIVSPATTAGWRTSEVALAESLTRLGVSHRVERVDLDTWAGRHLRRAWLLVDGVEAWASRRLLDRALAEASPRAVILITSTAALLAPIGRLRSRGLEVAVRLDCPTAVNRPGPQNAPQRAIERRRLPQASLVIAMGPRSAANVAGLAERVVSLPTAIDVAPDGAGDGTPRVVTYAADPFKKGLELTLRAWSQLGERRRGALLSVNGLEPAAGRAFLARQRLAEPEGVEWAGMLERDRYLELLGSARAYVSASWREDHGIAQLEAIAAGVPLVTTPSPGAYEAEPLARALAPDLVVPRDDPAALAGAVAAALAMDGERREAYRAAAARAIEPFRPAATDAVMRDQVLPVLLPPA